MLALGRWLREAAARRLDERMAFAPAAGWKLSQAESMRSWLTAHHIQQCIIPVNGTSSVCEPALAWGQFTSWISYQPHGRLLIFQAAWAGTLLAAVIAALGLAIWRVTASR